MKRKGRKNDSKMYNDELILIERFMLNLLEVNEELVGFIDSMDENGAWVLDILVNLKLKFLKNFTRFLN